jgi:hypothetical protein
MKMQKGGGRAFSTRLDLNTFCITLKFAINSYSCFAFIYALSEWERRQVSSGTRGGLVEEISKEKVGARKIMDDFPNQVG